MGPSRVDVGVPWVVSVVPALFPNEQEPMSNTYIRKCCSSMWVARDSSSHSRFCGFLHYKPALIFWVPGKDPIFDNPPYKGFDTVSVPL